MLYGFRIGYTFPAIHVFMERAVGFDQLEFRANSTLSCFILLRFIITAKYIKGVFWSIFVKMNEKKGKIENHDHNKRLWGSFWPPTPLL